MTKLRCFSGRVARGSKFWDPTTRNLDPTRPTNFPGFLDPIHGLPVMGNVLCDFPHHG